MPRAIGSATISFGLVSIPVKVYSTNQSSASISFNFLHEACGSRLKQQYLCKQEDVVVPRDQMIKGYEFAKGQYVTFTNEELKAVEQEANRQMEIGEFVLSTQVDPLYYDTPYYLGPGPGGEKPYRLLSEAMQETGRVAIARYASRGKQYIVMIRPHGDGLVMQQLRYADEVKAFDDIDLGEPELKDLEKQLAIQLIEQIASDTFDPSAYEDSVKNRILELIDQKVAGEDITFAAEESQDTKIVDIMEALRASLSTPDAAPAEDARKVRAKKKSSKKAKKKAAKG